MLAGKHHDSAVCTLAAVLLTRIAACLRAGTHYLLRDTDGRVITEAQGRAIVAERYTVSPEVRAARRKVTPTDTHDATSGTSVPRQESPRAPRHRPFRNQHEPPTAIVATLDIG